jgi:2-dehydropantoate 2-reductase
MKIAVVGCGAVGTYYGARLCQAGHEVHFLLRSDFDVVHRDGVRVESVDGDFSARPMCASASGAIGVADLVLVALKTTANGCLPELLPPLLGQDTVVVSLQNGLGDEEQMAAVVGAERVMGGLCFVCLNRVGPGVVRHTAHGLIVLGEHGRSSGERAERLASVLRGAGISCRVTPDLARAHWEKLVWNVPFNGLGVAAAAGYEAVVTGRVEAGRPTGRPLPTDALLDGGRWEVLVRELMLEVIEAARAQGHALERDLAREQIERTRVMGAYRASTLLDFELGRPLELESLFREPLRRARAAGVRAPRMAALCEVLTGLTEGRG